MKDNIKTEHNGAKNHGGFWGTRKRAKSISKKLRRRHDKQATQYPSSAINRNKI